MKRPYRFFKKGELLYPRILVSRKGWEHKYENGLCFPFDRLVSIDEVPRLESTMDFQQCGEIIDEEDMLGRFVIMNDKMFMDMG